MADLRKLKEKATEAFAKGKFAKAAEFYADYCKEDPRDLQARLRMGDAFAKAGNKPKAIDAYTSAAEGFAKEGFLPRAIAASKLILELDPAHKGVQQMLAGLYARKTGAPSSVRRPSAGASAVATANELPSAGGANRRAPIDLPPDTTSGAEKVEIEATSAPAAQSKRSDPLQPPSPLNRKDAIELPPDDSAPPPAPKPAPVKAEAPKPLVPPPPAAPEISLELEPLEAARADSAPVEIVEEKSGKAEANNKVYDLSLEDSGGIDLSAELPPELQTGLSPPPPKKPEPVEEITLEVQTADTPASPTTEEIALDVQGAEAPPEKPEPKAEPTEAAAEVIELDTPKQRPPEPPPEAEISFEAPVTQAPRAADSASDNGVSIEIEGATEVTVDFDTPNRAEPAPEVKPPPPPAMAPPLAAPSSSRIWIPTTAAAETPAPVTAGPTTPFATPRQDRAPKTDLEASLRALSRFDEIDAELQKPLPPESLLKPRKTNVTQAPAAAKPPEVPPPPAPPKPAPAQAAEAAPPAARKPLKRFSFTELEVEGDSLLHAVEAAAAVGASQRGEEDRGEDEIVYGIDDAPTPGVQPDALPKIPLFSDLPPDAFIELFERCPLRRFNEGERILEQGSVGDSFFVICAGAVRIFRVDGGQRRDLATLQEGTFFGEMALLSGSPRTASVEAAGEETQLLEISAPILTQLSHTYPTVAQALKKFMRQRLLSNVMNSSPLFAPFNKSDRRMLVEKFRARDVQKGDVLIKEGERSDGLYIVLSGEVEVKKANQLLAHLKEGEIFGEMSLLQKTPASATVQASKRTSLLRLPREQFDELVLSHPQILMLVSELTDTRKKETEALLAGSVKASEDGLLLV